MASQLKVSYGSDGRMKLMLLSSMTVMQYCRVSSAPLFYFNIVITMAENRETIYQYSDCLKA
jgi:hypothetical protein